MLTWEEFQRVLAAEAAYEGPWSYVGRTPVGMMDFTKPPKQITTSGHQGGLVIEGGARRAAWHDGDQVTEPALPGEDE